MTRMAQAMTGICMDLFPHSQGILHTSSHFKPDSGAERGVDWGWILARELEGDEKGVWLCDCVTVYCVTDFAEQTTGREEKEFGLYVEFYNVRID